MVLGALGTATVLYVLSYAPYIRYRHGASGYPNLSGLPETCLVLFDFDADWLQGSHRGFAPVEWLIDETPLTAPLRTWARVWGTQKTFAELQENRNLRASLRRLETDLGTCAPGN